MCMYLWWPILLHIPLHGDIFCTRWTSPCWPKFYKYDLLLLPSLYTREFYGLFCIITSSWRAYIFMGDILWLTCVLSFGDLFCSYTYLLSVTYSVLIELFEGFVVHIPPHVDLFSIFTTCSCPRGVMVKAMNCGIVVREFVLQSRYYVHFQAITLGKGMNPLILPPAMGK